VASVYKRGKVWWVGFTTSAGLRRNEATKARTRDEAKKLAAEIDARHERIRRGFEVEPGDSRLTFRQLFETWWERHGSKLRGNILGGKAAALRKHVLPELGDVVLREVTPARLELAFDRMSLELAGSSVNTLRAQLRAIFGWAKKRGLWLGENPAAATEKRKELDQERDELTAEEVPRLLAALEPRWRPLFACALLTGMRKGELAGLRREDVDLAAGSIRVGRSWSAETTKGGTTKTLPIAAALRPYLEQALATSKGSDLVFPRADGSMMRNDVKLAPMLRRAMARAGLTRGWTHTCRRTSPERCGFKERRDHNRVEPCPKCSFRLWPKPIFRQIRFQDTRATTATLLARSGASVAVAQRVLRHADPALTMKVYTRVRAEDMRSALDAMVPGLAPPPPPAPPVELEARALAVNAPPAAALPLQWPETARRATNDGPQALSGPHTSEALPARFERAASSFGGKRSQSS